jgi:hypothetical protein
VPPLARQIEREANAVLHEPGDPRVEVGGAAIAWQGWRGGSAAPLDIRLSGVRLRGPTARCVRSCRMRR